MFVAVLIVAVADEAGSEHVAASPRSSSHQEYFVFRFSVFPDDFFQLHFRFDFFFGIFVVGLTTLGNHA